MFFALNSKLKAQYTNKKIHLFKQMDFSLMINYTLKKLNHLILL